MATGFSGCYYFPKQLEQVHTLVLARSTLADQQAYDLLQRTPNLKALHLGLAYKTSPALDNPYTILDSLEIVSQTVETLSMGVEYYPFSRGNHVLDYSDGGDRGFPGLSENVSQNTLCRSPHNSSVRCLS